jgi:hypothetical protein
MRVEFNAQQRNHWLNVELTHRHLRVKSRLEEVLPIESAVNHEVMELRPGETLEYALGRWDQ